MRRLTNTEINILETRQRCCSDNWDNILVADDFETASLRNSGFYGYVRIGEGAKISDTRIIKGSGKRSKAKIISVLNEGGDGNIVLCPALTSQLAYLMMHYPSVFSLVKTEVEHELESYGGREWTIIGEGCVIEGATKIVDCIISSRQEAPVYIGPDVIMENSVTACGAIVTDGAKIYESFVGEAAHLGKGFSSEASVFFADAYMDNGEACAALCGPFSCSHHKSTLLIGGQFSFYNAGSNTNQSNHAYKMGPIHWGIFERGAKTASGCHILWPAHIGAFSMVMGKLTQHPRIQNLPFSYILAGEKTYIVPGINIKTVGTWRDVGKWPKRDVRHEYGKRDLVNFDFPNPYIIQFVAAAIDLLDTLEAQQGTDAEEYSYEGCFIKRSALVKGRKYYQFAMRLFGGSVPDDEWIDLCGMLAPKRYIDNLISDINDGDINSTSEIESTLADIHRNYEKLAGGRQDAGAWEEWKRMVMEDARKEYEMGDVTEEQFTHFLTSMDN